MQPGGGEHGRLLAWLLSMAIQKSYEPFCLQTWSHGMTYQLVHFKHTKLLCLVVLLTFALSNSLPLQLSCSRIGSIMAEQPLENPNSFHKVPEVTFSLLCLIPSPTSPSTNPPNSALITAVRENSSSHLNISQQHLSHRKIFSPLHSCLLLACGKRDEGIQAH